MEEFLIPFEISAYRLSKDIGKSQTRISKFLDVADNSILDLPIFLNWLRNIKKLILSINNAFIQNKNSCFMNFKNSIFFRFFIFLIFMFFIKFSLAQSNIPTEMFFEIRNQIWAYHNLNVDKFKNGDKIPEAQTPEDWILAGKNHQPAWCYFNNEESNGLKYGKIYNYYAIKDPRGIAPDGFRLPTELDFKILQESLYDDDGNFFFNQFGAKRSGKGDFHLSNKRVQSWCFSEIDRVFANFYDIRDVGFLSMGSAPNEYGFNVRCIKEENSQLNPKKSDKINTIKIGEQIWADRNLNVNTFRNGDSIFQAKTKEQWNKCSSQKIPACCSYNFDSNFDIKYGKLYNWFAVADDRGLAPVGYHIPSFDEFNSLVDMNQPSAGYKLKSKKGWKKSCSGDNYIGFNGMPGGRCWDEYGQSLTIFGNPTPLFEDVGIIGFWWTCSDSHLGSDANEMARDFELDCGKASHRIILSGDYDANGSKLGRWGDNYTFSLSPKGAGLSIRCIKNKY